MSELNYDKLITTQKLQASIDEHLFVSVCHFRSPVPIKIIATELSQLRNSADFFTCLSKLKAINLGNVSSRKKGHYWIEIVYIPSS